MTLLHNYYVKVLPRLMAILDFRATSYAVECHIPNALTDEMRERFLKLWDALQKSRK